MGGITGIRSRTRRSGITSPKRYPAATHEDPRYYTLDMRSCAPDWLCGQPSLSHAETDSGADTFNLSEIAGNLMGAVFPISTTRHRSVLLQGRPEGDPNWSGWISKSGKRVFGLISIIHLSRW